MITIKYANKPKVTETKLQDIELGFFTALHDSTTQLYHNGTTKLFICIMSDSKTKRVYLVDSDDSICFKWPTWNQEHKTWDAYTWAAPNELFYNYTPVNITLIIEEPC